MTRIPAQSIASQQAQTLVSGLQQRFATALEHISKSLNYKQTFSAVAWFRDQGIHGGGVRFETADGAMIGRGSVNVSQVHYDDNPKKKLGSATAISTIIHPIHAHAPSVHIHISWTEMKSGQGYWRMMADLNPAIENPAATATFLAALEKAAPTHYASAVAQGESYFFIPALKRHRGVAHFYLEAFHSDDATADIALAQAVGEAAIDTYVEILASSLQQAATSSTAAKAEQLAYHSLYFFQVLTLDRGTTTGLLVHEQNDVGIMGSLPAYVDRKLLQSWVEKLASPQDQLLQNLIHALPEKNPCLIDEQVKKQLAQVVRSHYQKFPQAINMQAAGKITATTVGNHR